MERRKTHGGKIVCFGFRHVGANEMEVLQYPADKVSVMADGANGGMHLVNC